MSSRKVGNIIFTNINVLLIIGGILSLSFLGYVFFHVYKSEGNVLSILIIPLILGIIFENYRLSSDWKTIALKIIGSLMLSVFAFMPGKQERPYNIENHIEDWPYYFIFFFVVISVINHGKKTIPRLTEGITLIQSISIIYWVMDFGLQNFENGWSYLLLLIGLLFCFISFIYAFSYLTLKSNIRFFLSIWSSIIMLIFAIDLIKSIDGFQAFSDFKIMDQNLNILQYFLVGVSLIYVFQNAIMLAVYIPTKYRFFNSVYLEQIRDMNKKHIERYSDNQINISDAFVALIFTSGFYFFNYKYQIMPRNTIIWLVFWVFPFVIVLKEKLIGRLQNRRQH